MPELTPNLGLKKPLGNERVTRANYNENLDIIDAAAVKKGNGIAELIGGTLADRPDPGVAGRYYFAQDKGEIWLDTGTEWVLAAASNAELVAHLADDVQHITAAERTAWDAKISASLLTTKGDILYHTGTGLARLPRGTTGQILKVKSDGSLEWGELDVIQPTKPKTADFANNSAAPSTWYTVVDVTSGKGILSRFSSATTSILMDKVTLRLTIDGTVQTITLSYNKAREFGDTITNTYDYDFVFHTFFTSSMKIEVMHTDTSTSASAGYLYAAVDYNLV